VQVVPADLSSALATRPEFQVVLNFVDADRASVLLEAALRSSRVRRLADGVTTDVAFQAFQTSGDPLAPVARICPTEDLLEGWYELRVPSSVDLMTLSPGGATRFEDGSWGIRFRIGHGPVISAVSLCESRDLGKPPVIVAHFSEATRLPAGLSVQSAFAVADSVGRTIRCWEAADDYPQITMLRLANGDAIARWELFCERMPDTLDLSFAAGIEGEDGSKLTDLAGTPGTSVRTDASLLAAEGDCRVWRP
jgi:hypothetical protein